MNTVAIHPHHLIRKDVRDYVFLLECASLRGRESLLSLSPVFLHWHWVGDHVRTELLEQVEGGQSQQGRVMKAVHSPQFVQKGDHSVLDQDVVLVQQLWGRPKFSSEPLLSEDFVAFETHWVILIKVNWVGVEEETWFNWVSSGELRCLIPSVVCIFGTDSREVSHSLKEALGNVIIALAHAPCAQELKNVDW